MQKPIFITKATALPADWANAVSDLVYDAFNLCRTLQDVRTRLGLEGLAYQDHRNVNIQGGGINGVVIGATSARAGTFTQITLQELTPRQPNSATSKYYVDGLVAESIGALSWKDMAQQRSNAVSITGGSGVFDRLLCRRMPTIPEDVVPLGFLQEQTNASLPQQANTPMVVAGDNRTVTLPFNVNVSESYRLVIFVDGIYQLPDQYVLTSTDTVVFNVQLPTGVVIGGYRL